VTPALVAEAGDRFDLEITGTARDLTSDGRLGPWSDE
jgi:hypothetical protein